MAKGINQGYSPVVIDMAAMLEKRTRRAADFLEEEVSAELVKSEWSKVARQLTRPEVVENILKLAGRRLEREPGTIRSRKAQS